MNGRERRNRGADMAPGALLLLWVAMMAMFVMIGLCGCSRRTAPTVSQSAVERRDSTAGHVGVRVDSLWRYVWLRDSVSRRDSVATVIRGDTVLIDRWHWLEAWHGSDTDSGRQSAATDTVTVVVERQVTVTETKTVEVAAPLRRWQKSLMWCGALALLWLAWRLWRRWKR